MNSDSFHESQEDHARMTTSVHSPEPSPKPSPKPSEDEYGNPLGDFTLTPDEDGSGALEPEPGSDEPEAGISEEAEDDLTGTVMSEAATFGEEMPEEEGLSDAANADFDEVIELLKALQREFQNKIKYDAHKNKIIDDLHRELQGYKNDIINSQLNSFIMDIIQFIDNMRKLGRHYTDQPAEEVDPEKLVDILDGIPADVEDLLARQGIFTFESEDERFDATRQRVLKRIETTDPSRDKMIAERIQPGYERDDKMIRPEIVSVYLYKPADAHQQTGEGDG